MEADKIPLSVRCDCCSVAAKAMEPDTTIQWDNICLTILLKTWISKRRSLVHSLTSAAFDCLLDCILSDVQKKAKQIYETQKKKEEMTEAESEELAVRRRKICNFVSRIIFWLD